MPHFCPRHVPIDPDPVYAVRLLMEPVVAELVDDVEHDENTACQTDRQSQYIDKGISRMPGKIAECDLDDVSEHVAELLWNPIN